MIFVALTGVTCNVLHVSVLHISQHPNDLTRLSRELENSIMDNGNAISSSRKEETFHVNAFCLPGIKRSVHDTDSLMIQVFQEDRYESDSDNDDEEYSNRFVGNL